MLCGEKNRIEPDSLKKIRDLVASARICMVSNNVMDWPLSSISVRNQWIDDDGTIWLLFVRTGPENPVLDGGRIELFYANSGATEFLTLSGTASFIPQSEIPISKDILPFSKTLESEALSPAIGVFRFSPADAYYWDNDRATTVRLALTESNAA